MKRHTRRIPLTQGKFAIVDAIDYDFISQFKWFAHKRPQKHHVLWYAKRSLHHSRKDIAMHHVVAERAGLPQSKMYDHKNLDGLDCRRANIRPCNKSQNAANVPKSPGRSSRYKGVNWNKGRHRWVARITCNQKQLYLGLFVSERQAHLAYAEAAQRIFGEFARAL